MPTVTPWMATQQPVQSVISANQSAVFLQCFYRILRACWIEAALLTKKRTQQFLISPYECYKYARHYVLSLIVAGISDFILS